MYRIKTVDATIFGCYSIVMFMILFYSITNLSSYFYVVGVTNNNVVLSICDAPRLQAVHSRRPIHARISGGGAAERR